MFTSCIALSMFQIFIRCHFFFFLKKAHSSSFFFYIVGLLIKFFLEFACLKFFSCSNICRICLFRILVFLLHFNYITIHWAGFVNFMNVIPRILYFSIFGSFSISIFFLLVELWSSSSFSSFSSSFACHNLIMTIVSLQTDIIISIWIWFLLP